MGGNLSFFCPTLLCPGRIIVITILSLSPPPPPLPIAFRLLLLSFGLRRDGKNKSFRSFSVYYPLLPSLALHAATRQGRTESKIHKDTEKSTQFRFLEFRTAISSAIFLENTFHAPFFGKKAKATFGPRPLLLLLLPPPFCSTSPFVNTER